MTGPSSLVLSVLMIAAVALAFGGVVQLRRKESAAG
jgi:LPXTG-motif cell wall-anchored protein